MKVTFLVVALVAAVSADGSCGSLDPASFTCCVAGGCPADVIFDGNCCPTDKVCCSLEVGNVGSGVWTCCNPTLNQVCTANADGVTRSCAVVAPTPKPTAMPTVSTACKNADMQFNPPVACSFGLFGTNCGANAYCNPVAGTNYGTCCHINREAEANAKHTCSECVAAGFHWHQHENKWGCTQMCDADEIAAGHCAAVVSDCPAYIDPKYTNMGTCWMRCDAEHALGWTQLARSNAPQPWNTGYPEMGVTKYGAYCSCDADCRNPDRADANGNPDCCVDSLIYCGH